MLQEKCSVLFVMVMMTVIIIMINELSLSSFNIVFLFIDEPRFIYVDLSFLSSFCSTSLLYARSYLLTLFEK